MGKKDLMFQHYFANKRQISLLQNPPQKQMSKWTSDKLLEFHIFLVLKTIDCNQIWLELFKGDIQTHFFLIQPKDTLIGLLDPGANF